MKALYKIGFGFILPVLMLMNISCSEDSDGLVLSGNDANILSCIAVSEAASFRSFSIGDSIVINVPDYVDFSNLTVKVEVSEYAQIKPLPDSISDWSIPVHFVVTSENGQVKKDYVISIAKGAGDEKVFDGEIRIGSQSELDNFFESAYTEVESITLFTQDYGDPIRDLSRMSSLKKINGGLYILDISARNLSLPSLESAGSVYIVSTAATKIDMPKLKFVAERFQVGEEHVTSGFPLEHRDMEEVNLPSLEFVGGLFQLFLCSKIETLESLSNLNFIGKDLYIWGGVFETLKGLENIKEINGEVLLNGRLTSLDGFAIERVAGIFTLFVVDSITDLSPLAALEHVGEGLILKNSEKLTSLTGVEGINTPSVSLENFRELESLEGLHEFTELKKLILRGLVKVSDLTALSKLQTVEELRILALPELASLAGLESLTSVSKLQLTELEKLEDISALSNLNTVSDLRLSRLLVLTDISAFSNVTELGNLYFENLLSLTNLNGLDNITKITKGGLSILACKELTDISGLSNVSEVSFYAQSEKIWFQDNEKLADYTPVAELIKKYMNVSKVHIKNNFYNPTKDDINNGQYIGEGGTGISGGR